MTESSDDNVQRDVESTNEDTQQEVKVNDEDTQQGVKSSDENAFIGPKQPLWESMKMDTSHIITNENTTKPM